MENEERILDLPTIRFFTGLLLIVVMLIALFTANEDPEFQKKIHYALGGNVKEYDESGSLTLDRTYGMFGRVKSEYLVDEGRIYDRTYDISGYISQETVRKKENHMLLEKSELQKFRNRAWSFIRPQYIFTDVYEDGRLSAEYNYDLHGGKGKTLYEVNYLRPDADGYIGYDHYNHNTGALRETYRQNQEGGTCIEYDESTGEIFIRELLAWKSLRDTVTSVLALESELFDTDHYYLQAKESYTFDGTYFEVTRDTEGRIEKVHCTATK